jgi:hypothetical protein
MESTNKDFVPNGNEKNYDRGICICTNPYESRQTKPLGKDWIGDYDSDFRFPIPATLRKTFLWKSREDLTRERMVEIPFRLVSCLPCEMPPNESNRKIFILFFKFFSSQSRQNGKSEKCILTFLREEINKEIKLNIKYVKWKLEERWDNRNLT